MVNTLIVDDTKETRIVLAQLVEQAGGRVVGDVASGPEALSWLQTHTAQLVITDFQMPGMNGVELAHAIRADYPDLRIALISVVGDAMVTPEDSLTSLDWILSKPTTVARMAEIIRNSTSHSSRLTKLSDTFQP